MEVNTLDDADVLSHVNGNKLVVEDQATFINCVHKLLVVVVYI